MSSSRIIKGDLIQLAKEGNFDVIGHGCNCFCTMTSGIAPLMAEAFGCNEFPLEWLKFEGDVNKLGNIDHQSILINGKDNLNELTVVNCYTQYAPGVPDPFYHIPLNYTALELCMRKINHTFKGKKVGLPWIGCGLAGGNRGVVENIIKQQLIDCDVTIVEL